MCLNSWQLPKRRQAICLITRLISIAAQPMTQLTRLQILQVRHSLQAVQSAAAGTVSRTAAKLTDVAEDRKGSHRRLRLPWRRKHKQHEYGPKQSSGFL